MWYRLILWYMIRLLVTHTWDSHKKTTPTEISMDLKHLRGIQWSPSIPKQITKRYCPESLKRWHWVNTLRFPWQQISCLDLCRKNTLLWHSRIDDCSSSTRMWYIHRYHRNDFRRCWGSRNRPGTSLAVWEIFFHVDCGEKQGNRRNKFGKTTSLSIVTPQNRTPAIQVSTPNKCFMIWIGEKTS